MDLTVLRQISYGMYVVGAREDGKNAGCVINTCIQVTSEQPVMAICLNKNNYTYGVVSRQKQFTLSILSEQTDPLVIPYFGFSSSRDNDKFAKVPSAMWHELPVLQENSCGNLYCRVIHIEDMGTHGVIFARLEDTAPGLSASPMTYSYYHRVIKGKAPKSAPTYQAEEPSGGKVRYVCSVCGYVYEGDLTKEPDSYRCPICGADKSKFVRK